VRSLPFLSILLGSCLFPPSIWIHFVFAIVSTECRLLSISSAASTFNSCDFLQLLWWSSLLIFVPFDSNSIRSHCHFAFSLSCAVFNISLQSAFYFLHSFDSHLIHYVGFLFSNPSCHNVDSLVVLILRFSFRKNSMVPFASFHSVRFSFDPKHLDPDHSRFYSHFSWRCTCFWCYFAI